MPLRTCATDYACGAARDDCILRKTITSSPRMGACAARQITVPKGKVFKPEPFTVNPSQSRFSVCRGLTNGRPESLSLVTFPCGTASAQSTVEDLGTKSVF